MAKVTARPPKTQLETALGVTKVTTVEVDEKVLFSASERELLRKGEYSSHALTVEDNDIWDTESLAQSGYPSVVQPTYDFMQLSMLVQANNSLLQAVSAMEVNEAGTGFEFERTDGKDKTKKDDKAIEDLRQFFDEPYPDTSFVTMRREIRRDLETTGNGYMEVIRAEDGDIVFLRRLDAKLMRLVRLDESVVVDKTINRMGKEQTVQMVMRERRFVMAVGKRLVFFREFGASREINRTNGYWEDDPRAGKIDEKNSGTEVIHLTVISDVHTNYGVPRWINNVPSVLGSREAELYNLEFFKHGGLPPVIFFLNGGSLSGPSRESLTNYLAGKARLKQRGMVVEVATTSGTWEKGGPVGVTTERFGSEKQNDAMFMGYDERCADHVRESFRLPKLFVGRSDDMNFATAYTAYMTAEAQVFKPERDEFDEIINVKIMRELAPDYRFRSLAVTLKDVTQQLTAIAQVAQFVEVEKMIEIVNELVGVDLIMREGADEVPDPMAMAAAAALPPGTPGAKAPPVAAAKPAAAKPASKGSVVPFKGKGAVTKAESDALVQLAETWAAYLSGDSTMTEEQALAVSAVVQSLQPSVRALFNKTVGDSLSGRVLVTPGEADALQAAGRAIVSKRLRNRADAGTT